MAKKKKELPQAPKEKEPSKNTSILSDSAAAPAELEPPPPPPLFLPPPTAQTVEDEGGDGFSGTISVSTF
jgi:hypothetical protein